MCVYIAIAEPTGCDPAYNQRSLPAYLAALRSAGATPIIVPLHERQERIARLLAGVQGILLPGSKFDIDPQRYGEDPVPGCGESDAIRTAVDELLLQDAFNLQKPTLAICHGVQTLNVWLNGSLVQDLKTGVDHRPGRDVAEQAAEKGLDLIRTPEEHPSGAKALVDFAAFTARLKSCPDAKRLFETHSTSFSAAWEAHPVRITPGSRLAGLVPLGSADQPMVNSSHHQAIHVPGDGLLVSAVSPVDGVVEAVELESCEHFVLGVQWHPERAYTESALSRAIFAAFVQAAAAWKPQQIEDSVTPA
jgi:putative glutamine amidotransferase